MTSRNLILDLPQGVIVATSLGVEGLARHRSPGSGKHLKGRSVMFDLALEDGKLGFRFEVYRFPAEIPAAWERAAG